MWPEVALVALKHQGTPAHYLSLLETAWAAPRYCVVNGEVAEPIFPTRGLPQGLPECPRGLGAVLGPWAAQVRANARGVRPWKFMDDRTLSARRANAGNLQIAHDLTKRFEKMDRATLSALREGVRKTPPVGEYVVVIAGADEGDTSD